MQTFFKLIFYFLRHIKVLRQAAFSDLLKMISVAFGYPPSSFRLWLFSQRTNNSWRPTLLDASEVSSYPGFNSKLVVICKVWPR